MGQAVAEEPDARGVELLGYSDCVEWRTMPLLRSLAHVKREISKKKWAEARQWAGGRDSRKMYKMLTMQKPDGTVACSSSLQEERLEVLPAEARSPPHRAVLTLDEESAHWSVLVSLPDTDTGPPLQGVPRVEAPEEYLVGGRTGGGREGEESVQDPGPLC